MAQTGAKSEIVSGKDAAAPAIDQEKFCGIVMPISAMDVYSSAHWDDVYSIVAHYATNVGFTARRVNTTVHSNIIIGEIVRNLALDPMVVCDVSGNNPNVLFELGMRLAFDKPTIVIKDERTANYPFDIFSVEYLEYPADLHHRKVQEFQSREDLLIELLFQMSRRLRYNFDKTHIKTAVYSPAAHGELEDDMRAIRKHWRDLLEGRRILPMYVTNLPPLPQQQVEPSEQNSAG